MRKLNYQGTYERCIWARTSAKLQVSKLGNDHNPTAIQRFRTNDSRLVEVSNQGEEIVKDGDEW